MDSGGPSPCGAGGEPTRRQRSVYTSQQIAQLEAYFQFNEYIDGERKKQLSQLTNIPEQQIKVWFQNRRQKKKREQEEQNQQQQQMHHAQTPSRGHSAMGGLMHQSGSADDDDDDLAAQWCM